MIALKLLWREHAQVTLRLADLAVAVVHGDEDLMRSLQDLLESKNHTVRTFASPAALLESGCLPQLGCLILDTGTSGADANALLKRIHAARPGLPTILIIDRPETLKRLPQLPGIYPGLFTKPCKAEELVAAVSAVFRTRP